MVQAGESENEIIDRCNTCPEFPKGSAGIVETPCVFVRARYFPPHKPYYINPAAY